MPHDITWSIDSYREEYESDEHWKLRKDFMDKWKPNFTEQRVVCLARVFANIELLGCRYPPEVMKEVAALSDELVKSYRQKMKHKLKRTFVSASDAAEDRARGVKREGGLVVDNLPQKSAKIAFVPQGHKAPNTEEIAIASEPEDEKIEDSDKDEEVKTELTAKSASNDAIEPRIEYMKEMQELPCLDFREFNDSLFETEYGRFVLLIRPWTSRLGNIHASCAASHLEQQSMYENGIYTLTISGKIIAQASGPTRAQAKSSAETIAWSRMREECVSVVIKELWIAQGDTRIGTEEVSGKHQADQFGTPIESSVATKMMMMMGWKGGGLGAEAQGISEPIKPHLQMVNRAGLGSGRSKEQFRRGAVALFQRYHSSECLDLDLVFSSDFDKEERAALHQLARRAGLASNSYGKDAGRFMVVKKKLNPFALVKAVLEKGGVTPKYQVFLPRAMKNRRRN